MASKQRTKAAHYKRREANTGRGNVRWEPPLEALIALNLMPDSYEADAPAAPAPEVETLLKALP
jgi:hypothetical protein